MSKVIKVLFVCTGNICRSPLAEAVLEHHIKVNNLQDRLEVASAGTSAYHVGQSPDVRAVAVARKFKLNLSHVARQVTTADLDYYNYVLVMEHTHYEEVVKLAHANSQSKILLLRSFDPRVNNNSAYDVPDPYYGQEADFEEVVKICQRSIRGFLSYIDLE